MGNVDINKKLLINVVSHPMKCRYKQTHEIKLQTVKDYNKVNDQNLNE